MTTQYDQRWAVVDPNNEEVMSTLCEKKEHAEESLEQMKRSGDFEVQEFLIPVQEDVVLAQVIFEDAAGEFYIEHVREHLEQSHLIEVDRSADLLVIQEVQNPDLGIVPEKESGDK